MAVPLDKIIDVFNKFYIITGFDEDRIPSQIVFSRLAFELDVSNIYPAEIKGFIDHMKLNKKAVAYSNGSNHFVESIKKGHYTTITSEMRDEFITKYTDMKRFTLNTIMGIREKSVIKEDKPANNIALEFQNKKTELLNIIQASLNMDDMIAQMRTFLDTNTVQNNTEGIVLLDNYKSNKKITITKAPTTIKFNT